MPDGAELSRFREELVEAVSLIRRGHADQAVPVLDRLIESDPSCFLALRERGFAKSFRGDHAGALADFTTIVRLRPADPAGFPLRAAARAKAGDLGGAIEDYSSAISLNPRHPYAYLQRGRLKAASGDLDGAVTDFTADMECCSHGRLSGLLNRGQVKHRLGDLTGAIGDLTEAMRLEVGQPINAPLLRGRVKMDARDYQGAIVDFTAAIESFPGLTNAYRHRAEARALVGDREGEADDLRAYDRLGGCDLPAYE